MAERTSKTIAIGILTTIFAGLFLFFFQTFTELFADVERNKVLIKENQSKIENQKDILLRIDQRVYEIHRDIYKDE